MNDLKQPTKKKVLSEEQGLFLENLVLKERLLQTRIEQLQQEINLLHQRKNNFLVELQKKAQLPEEFEIDVDARLILYKGDQGNNASEKK